jgi:nitrogen fixation protein NifQ
LPQEANVDSDESFDKHVLASVLALALAEGGALTTQTGLSHLELKALLSEYFPNNRFLISGSAKSEGAVDDDEIEMVKELLLANRSSQGERSAWLAAMVARRALEPNHLWEDLGLRDRSELTRLMERHFRPLASRNDKNMRWKRFLYRVMCENDGLVMCSAPVCTNCADYRHCFGDETGTSRIITGLSDQSGNSARQRS